MERGGRIKNGNLESHETESLTEAHWCDWNLTSCPCGVDFDLVARGKLGDPGGSKSSSNRSVQPVAQLMPLSGSGAHSLGD